MDERRGAAGEATQASGDTDFGRDESWFAALGLAARSTRPIGLDEAPATLIEPGDLDDADDRAEAGGGAAPVGSNDRRRSAGMAERRGTATDPGDRRRAAEGPDPTGSSFGAGLPARLYAAFAWSRVLLASLLAVLPVLQGLLSTPLPQPLYPIVAGAYLLAVLVMVRTPRAAESLFAGDGLLRRRWVLATVGVDLVALAAFLGLLEASLNVAALFAVPVLMAGTLTRRRSALASAALATFALLGWAVWSADGADAMARYAQTGLTCAGLFALAALTSELAGRLAREERSARSSLALARQQALLNRLVIEEMEDGILVVDRGGRVRVANPAALRLIGAPSDLRLQVFTLQDQLRWRSLLEAVELAFRAGGWPAAGRDLVLQVPRREIGAAAGLPDDAASAAAVLEDRPLRVRMRFTRRRRQELGESLCVVFLEDLRTLRLRARQDKLAAMGRVSAGIAHEIRNPLSAIAQANALLAEDLADPGAQRLSRIVSDNVERLRRIVDDVMAAAPGGGGELSAPLIELVGHVRQTVADWMETNRLAAGPDSCVELTGLLAPDPVGPAREVIVRMEPDHLARVLVNLLDNALHHGSGAAGAVRVGLGLDARARASDPPELARALARRRHSPSQALLHVGSDGEPIAAEIEPRLFEPFFSTRSRGTGLGLYICRELCERHGVAIDYRRGGLGDRHPNVFVLRLPVAGAAPEATIAAGRTRAAPPR